HVGLGADANRGNVALRPDDVLERGDEFRGQAAVSNENHSDHDVSFNAPRGSSAGPNLSGDGALAAAPGAEAAAARRCAISRWLTTTRLLWLRSHPASCSAT